MYVSAAGQLEYPPDYNHAIPLTGHGDGERPAKRQKQGGPKNKNMPERPDLDAHQKAPEALKSLYKKWQKMQKNEMISRFDLIDLGGDPKSFAFPRHMVNQCTEHIPTGETVRNAFAAFMGEQAVVEGSAEPPVVYEPKSMPGLLVYPSLIPENVQIKLLDHLLHRDLSNPAHKTNVHLHYSIPYPPAQPHTPSNQPHASFFDPSARDLQYPPKASHAALTTEKMLDKKLRWMTLGGQYNWTDKAYPDSIPPPFPADIKHLIDAIFPMKAEAAICNVYSPGDTLSAHRDVAESCSQPLVSISLGCESVFLVGIEDDSGPLDLTKPLASGATHVPKGAAGAPPPVTKEKPIKTCVLKLRSGDAVLMSGRARWAWHGVPKVLPESCPEFLRGWPAVGGGGRYAAFEGWVKGKRVNLNVRQMFGAEQEGEEAVGGAGGSGAAEDGSFRD